MHDSLSSIIEVQCHICILFLFIIVFNPYNFYALLYDVPILGEIPIFFIPWLLGRGLHTAPHIYSVFLLCTNTLPCILYVCILQICVFRLVFLSIRFFSCRIIASQLEMNGVFNMISRPNTSLRVTFNVSYVVLKNQLCH